jgi:hypothetical protein
MINNKNNQINFNIDFNTFFKKILNFEAEVIKFEIKLKILQISLLQLKKLSYKDENNSFNHFLQ